MSNAPRYDFSSIGAFQTGVAIDIVVVSVASLVLAIAIGLVLARIVFDREDETLALALAPGFGLAALVAIVEASARVASPAAALVVALALALAAAVRMVRQPPRPDWRAIGLIAVAAALLAVLPLDRLFPKSDGGDAIYFGRAIYDHLKTAIVDTLAREGMPPHTPYVSLDGSPAALNYYYGWHLLAAAFRSLPRISSLGADVGLTLATTMAAAAAVGGLAWQLRPSPLSVAGSLLVMLCGNSQSLLQTVLPSAVTRMVLSSAHPFEGFSAQSPWVPQHIAAGLFVVLALVVLSRILDRRGPPLDPRGAVLGLLAATAALCSIWTGGIGLALSAVFVAPFLISDRDWRSCLLAATPALVLAALVGLAIAGPYVFYLRGLAAGAAQDLHFVTLRLYRTSEAVAADTLPGAIWQAINYATVWLAIQLGPAWPFGLYGLATLPHGGTIARFSRLARIYVPTVFAMVLFMHSALVHDDFSWRSFIPALLILCAAAGAVIGHLAEAVWTGDRRLPVLAGCALAAVLTVSGIYGSADPLGDIVLARAGDPNRQQFTRILAAGKAWQRVQALTEPRSIVLASAASFAAVSRPPGNLPWALFGDRRLWLSDYEWGIIFATQLSSPRLEAMYAAQERAFGGGVDAALMRRLHDEDKVEAILVAPNDAVHGTGMFDRGGYYTLAEIESGFEIHLARR